MGLTFYDISLIQGFNGAMLFSTQDGSLKTGFTNDLYHDALAKFKTKDSKKVMVYNQLNHLQVELMTNLLNIIEKKY